VILIDANVFMYAAGRESPYGCPVSVSWSEPWPERVQLPVPMPKSCRRSSIGTAPWMFRRLPFSSSTRWIRGLSQVSWVKRREA
jgi:hypothetical protein